ncbi:DUF5320 domain-containing protein [Fusibacter tunisiensis]|uniref:DUF5320 domain-containing protein n=1 Tax=Fusibacter tunisiensis TaxID=1008308 RepID=A0ABS2MQH8_9FIRM|nr:DUF5320 domain-containing protein [Fusibacter tunisiensis]MBM7561646.1 hypothetical protein [Fusibacter tunisiensis]
MPRRDGLGPMGQGAMTGRGLGTCGKGTGVTGYGLGSGRGFGCFRGFGRGNRRGLSRWNAGFSDQELLEEEKILLKNRLAEIENALNTTENK